MPKDRKISWEIQNNDNKKQFKILFRFFRFFFCLFVCFLDNKKERFFFKEAQELHFS